jgi:predicted Zn-dependent protease
MHYVDQALRINPTYAPALGLRGDLLRRRGSLLEAIDLYDAATRCDDSSVHWRLQAAQAELELNRPEAAEARLRHVTLRAPTDARGFASLAEALRRMGRDAEASAAAAQAARLASSPP